MQTEVIPPEHENQELKRRTSPYIGPRPFKAGERLYGREREKNTLFDLWMAQRIILLYSPSGAGKSSLIHAALLPSMTLQGFELLPTVRVNQEPSPELAVGEGFNRFTYSALLSLEEGQPAERRYPPQELAAMTLDAYLSRRCEEAEEPPTFLLVFDQFEEILTTDPTNREARKEFFLQLGLALRDRSRWALFAMREDYLAALDPYTRPVPTRLENRFRLDLLEVEGALQAIRRPVQDAGLDFEPQAAQKLVDDLRLVKVQQADGSLNDVPGLYIEPVQLQVVCSKLWQDLPENDQVITLADVEAIGDTNQALADYYNQQVKTVAAQTGVPERAIRKWFDTRLITVAGIRGQVPLGKDFSEGLDNRAVRLLERAYLLRGEKRGGATWFELAHDRLVHPVRDSNAAWFAAHLVPLQRQAEVWLEHGRPDGMLLSGHALEEAQAWAAEHSDELTDAERAFMEEALKARAAAERELRFHRRIRRLAIVATVIGVLAIIATLVAVFAFVGAQEERRKSNARASAYEAVSWLGTDPAISLVYALDSIEILGGPHLENRLALEALHNALAADRSVAFLYGHTDRIYAVAYSPDGERLATGSKDRSVIVWDIASGSILNTLTGHTGPVSDVAFLPGARSGVITSSWDGTIRVWDAGSGQVQMELIEPQPAGQEPPRVAALDLSPDGLRVAGAYSDGFVRIWSLETGQLEQAFLATRKTGPEGAPAVNGVETLAYSPDGLYLASGGEDGEGKIWDLANTSKPHRSLKGHTDLVNGIAYSPDGYWIATASADYSVRIWNANNGLQVTQLNGHTDWVYKAIFTPDSKYLISAGADRTIRYWDLKRDAEIFRLPGHTSQVFDLALSPDGELVASVSQDRRAILWNTTRSGSRELFTYSAGDRVLSVALDANGRAAAGTESNGAQVWDLAAGQVIHRLETNGASVRRIQFSPDGMLLAAGLSNGDLYIWNAADGQLLQRLEGAGFANDLAFQPANRDRLLITGPDGQLNLWDLANRQVIATLPPPDGLDQPVAAHAVAYHPSLDLAAAGYSDGSLVIWDLASRRAVVVMAALHTDPIHVIRFAGQGSRIISAGEDGLVALLNYDSQAHSLSEPLFLDRHLGPVYALAVAALPDDPTAEQFITAGSDLNVILWDLPDGAHQMTLKGHTGRVTGAAISPDGALLVTVGRDHTIRGVTLDPYELFDLAVERLEHLITRENCESLAIPEYCQERFK